MQATVKSPDRVTSTIASLAVSLNTLVSIVTAAGVLPDGATKPNYLGEYMKRLGFLVTVLICLLAMLPAANAQSVTGQISGTVVDPAGAVVPGATVQLTHDLSQQVHRYTTESNGSFIFTGLVPGAYSLRVTQAGFKGYDQKSITVATQERVDLHEIGLQVGDVTSTVEVQSNTVHVATDSSDRSISLNTMQIENMPTRGRNPVSLIMGMPGVQATGSGDYRGWNGGGIPGVNGGQQGDLDRKHADARTQSGEPHHGDAGRAGHWVGRLPRLERRRHPGRQRRTAGPDHPQLGRRGQSGLGQPESRLYLPQRGCHRRGQAADLQLHGGIRRAHRRPVDPDHQERFAPVPWHRLLVLPPRIAQRQRLLQQQDQRGETAVPLSESGLHHRSEER